MDFGGVEGLGSWGFWGLIGESRLGSVSEELFLLLVVLIAWFVRIEKWFDTDRERFIITFTCSFVVVSALCLAFQFML